MPHRFLSQIIAGIREQVEAYDKALAGHLRDPDNTDALNEVMRIAYNFADGAEHFISLVVGLSDLKPLLSWLTISSQCELAERFGDLPFSLARKAKPSLQKYRSPIAGARNRTFSAGKTEARPMRTWPGRNHDLSVASTARRSWRASATGFRTTQRTISGDGGR